MNSLSSSLFAVIAVPAKFQDMIQYAFYIILAILFVVAVGFAAWGGLSLERREEAFLKMKGCLMGFAMVAVIGAVFDYMGWSNAIGISFLNI